jgi:hypothetical protein
VKIVVLIFYLRFLTLLIVNNLARLAVREESFALDVIPAVVAGVLCEWEKYGPNMF